MGQEFAIEKANHLKALKKKCEAQLFIRTSGVFRKQWFSASAHKYEGWNFNSGNYLFTTDTI